MAEMNNWVKNMARSFGYAAKDAFKSYNPVLSNMIEETKDTKDELFSDISDLRSEFSISEERTLFQELKESSKDAFKNLWEDIRTGNLYNKDRQKAADNMMASALGFDLSDFEFDSSDFDDWGDDDWTADDSAKAEVAQSVKNTAATIRGMDIVGEKISTSVSTATVESARQISKATRDGSKALYALNKNGFNNVSRALMQVNDNIVSFAKVTEPMTQHFNNATIFFTKTTETLDKIEQHLAHMDRAADAKEIKYYEKGIGDIFNEDTGISVHAMYDMIKKNLKDDAWILDLAKDGMKNIRNMKMQGNSIGDSLPVGVWITKAITNVMIPKVFSEAMKEMNKNIATFTGSALLNLRDSELFGKANGTLMGILDYFMPQSSSKQKINTANYEKGAVAWDGISKKALTEVIPEYLSMIYSSLSGVNKKYDYNRGKFIDFKTIKEDIDNQKMNEARSAGGGYYDDAKAMAKKMGYSEKEAEEMLGKYFYNAVFGSDNQRKVALKVNKGEFSEEDRNTLGIDQKTLEVLQSTIQDYIRIMNKSVATRTKEEKEKARNFNKARVSLESARNSYADTMSSEEVSGISNMRYLLNEGSHGVTMGSKGLQFSEFSSIKDTLTDLSYTVKTIIPNYLQLMLYELNGHSSYMYWSDRQQRMRRNKAPKYYKANGSLVNVVAGTTTNNANNGHQHHTQGQGGAGSQQNAGSADDDAAAAPEYDIDMRDLLPDTEGNSGDNAETKKAKSKFGQLVDKISGKAKDFLGRWKTKDPNKAGKLIGGISNILNAVSYSVNTMFMGTSDDERKNNGLLGVLKAEVKNMFSGFTKFYEDFLKDHLDNIRDKIKEKFDEIFDKNEKLGDLRDRAKDFFKNSKDRAVEWMGGTVEELMFGTRQAKQRKYERDNNRYQANLQKYNELVQNLMSQATAENPVDEAKAKMAAAQQIFGVDNPDDAKPVAPRLAYGTNYVPKTGLAILSEGEMVIPTELNPFYNRPTNKASQIAKEKNIEKQYFGSFAEGNTPKSNAAKAYKYFKENFGFKNLSAKEFYEYYKSEGADKVHDMIFEDKHGKYKDTRRRRHAWEYLQNKMSDLTDDEIKEFIDYEGLDKVEDLIDEDKISANTENMGGLQKILYGGFAKSVRKAGRKLENFVDKSISGDKKSNENKDSVDTIKSKALEITSSIFDKDKDKRKQNAANAGAGAILGVGASLLTGCLVGPLFGAALGAGVGLVANNTKIQRALFGEENIDENGNYIEGKDKGLKGKIAKFVKKQLPDTLKGGGVGAAAGLFLGHPLLGAIVGSGIGFVKNSDSAKDALFGEFGKDGQRKGGVISKEMQEFLKKGLPKALVGGALGLLAGPFGVVPNLILGSSLGLYTQTEEFKNDFFGKDGDKKSQEESFVGQVKTKILGNLDELSKNTKNLLKGFFKSLGIVVPSKLKKLGGWVKGGLEKLTNSDNPFLNLLGLPYKAIRGIAGFGVDALGKVTGGLNRGVQKMNLKYGNDVYSRALGRNLTARERNIRRNTAGLFGTKMESNAYSDIDNILQNINRKSDMDDFKSQLEALKLAKNPEDKRKIMQELDSKFSSGDTKVSGILGTFEEGSEKGKVRIQKMIDLAETENKNKNWEEEYAKDTKEYQNTVVDSFKELLTLLKTSLVGQKNGETTGELADDIEIVEGENGKKYYKNTKTGRLVDETEAYKKKDKDGALQKAGNAAEAVAEQAKKLPTGKQIFNTITDNNNTLARTTRRITLDAYISKGVHYDQLPEDIKMTMDEKDVKYYNSKFSEKDNAKRRFLGWDFGRRKSKILKSPEALEESADPTWKSMTPEQQEEYKEDFNSGMNIRKWESLFKYGFQAKQNDKNARRRINIQAEKQRKRTIANLDTVEKLKETGEWYRMTKEEQDEYIRRTQFNETAIPTAARGGIFHASSRVPFAGNFSGLPYWGNHGLGDIAAGIKNVAGNALQGVKNFGSNVLQGAKNIGSGLLKGAATLAGGAYIGSKVVNGVGGFVDNILNAGRNAKNRVSNALAAFRGDDINISGGVAGGGGAGGGMQTTETEQGNKITTQFDMFGNPHQYMQKADGELVQVTNDKETDASNAMLGEFNSSIATVPVISSILTEMARTLSNIAGRVGTGSGGSGDGGSGEGNGEGGSGGKGGGIGAGAVGGGLLASASAFVKNAAIPALGVLGLSGALDKAGETIGNTELIRGNDTKSVFSAKSIMIGGQQIVTDEHGDPIIDEYGNYTTTNGNYINAQTGNMMDAAGNTIGSVDVTDVKTLGSNNTVKDMMWRNLGVRTIMNAKSGAGLATNLLGGFKNGGSLAGSMLNGRHAQNAAHALFGGQIKQGAIGRLLGRRNYNVNGIIPSVRNGLSRAGSAIHNSRIATGLRNIGSNIANSRVGTAVRGGLSRAGQAVKGVADDIVTKISTVIDDIFAKIVKSFQDGKLSKLIPQNVRSKIGKFFDALKEKLVPTLTKEAGESGAKSLANQLDDVLVALKIPMIVTAAVDGWGNAPSYLGVITPYQDLSFGSKFLAAALNALNMAIPFIGGLIPTKVFYTLFYHAAKLIFGGAGWEWLDKWEADRNEAEQVVSQYNQENGTALSIEEYNQMNGNAGTLTMMGNAYKEDVGQLGRTLSNEIKNEGVLGTIGEIGKGFLETAKEDGLGKMALDTMNESFIAQGMRGVNNGISNAVDRGVANGNVVASTYDKAMTGIGDGIVWAGDKLDSIGKFLSGGRSGLLPAGRGSSDKNFISQIDPKYTGIRVGNSTVDENGCAPAVASMVAGEYGKKLTMQSASSKANRYQEGANGTTVNYFGDTLAEQGIGTGILPNMQQVLGNLKQGNSVILLGQDPNNNSKDLSPFGPSNHYVLASGVDKATGRLIIKDPENTKPALYDPSILGSTTMAIGTSMNVPSQRMGGKLIASTRRSGLGDSIRRSGVSVKNVLSRVGNAGKNLFANAKNFLGNVFGKGSKGQAYPAEIWSWLHQEFGFTDFQTAAIQGCFQCESGNSPYCIEGYYLSSFPGYEAVVTNEGLDNFTVNSLFPAYAKSNISINKDAYKHDGHYYPGIGLAQWTGSRSYKLFKYAKENGKNWFDLQTQLEFLKSEFNSSYSGVVSKLKNSTNIEDATEIFAVGFENGNFKKGTKAYNERLEAAKSIYSTYSNQPLADVSNLPSSELGAAAGIAGAAGSVLSSLSSIASGDGTVLDKLNAIFSTALGSYFGVNSGSSGSESSSGYYDQNGNYISGVDLGALSNLDGPNKLVEIAKSQLGYQEKASNSQLDDPHANVGSSNWTKYGAFTGANGQPWCGSFVSWVFDQVVGGDREKMKKLLRTNNDSVYRSLAGVSNILDLAKSTGSFTNQPQKGDIVIYKNGGTSHTGIVSDVSNGQFSTIEGNTSGTPAGFDRDGGVVAAKGPRGLDFGKLTGFMRPDWNAVFPPTSGEKAEYTNKDFYTEPGSVYIDTSRFRKNLPAEAINTMKANGTLYDYAMKNEPQAIGFINKNKMENNFSTIFGNMPREAIMGTIQGKIQDRSLGSYVFGKVPSAVGFIDANKVTPSGGMPQSDFNTMVEGYKSSGDYSRWVLDNYSNAITYAGKGSGINGYINKYQTNRATRALNNWVKPIVNTDTSASVSNTYSGKASGMTTTRTTTQPAVRINTSAIQGIAKNIAQNSKDNNVNYQDLLVAIIKLLNAIAENTGAGGSLYSAIAKYLPAGSNVSKEDLESLAKLSAGAAATAMSAKADVNGQRNTHNMYNLGRGILKVRGDLAKVQYMG